MKLPLFLSKNHLRNCGQYWLPIITVSSFWNLCWIVTEILSHFVPAFEKFSSGNLWMLLVLVGFGLLIGISCFLIQCAKMLSVSQRLGETDIRIEIRVGDIFNIDEPLVISTSTTFNTDTSETSVQGQFAQRYYGNTEHLDHDIEKELEDQEDNVIEDHRGEEKKRYKLGTVVKLQSSQRAAYLVAIANMNEYGVDTGALEEMNEVLRDLWYYISERGELGPLVIPVLGTGHTRINVSSEVMIREIINLACKTPSL